MCVLRGKGKGRQVLSYRRRGGRFILFLHILPRKKIAAPLFICENWEEKTSFFAVTIRLLQHNSFSAAAMAAEKGRGGEGQNLNFSPGGGYNILPAIGCRNRQILCSIKSLSKCSLYTVHGNMGAAKVYALLFLLLISRNIWRFPS